MIRPRQVKPFEFFGLQYGFPFRRRAGYVVEFLRGQVVSADDHQHPTGIGSETLPHAFRQRCLRIRFTACPDKIFCEVPQGGPDIDLAASQTAPEFSGEYRPTVIMLELGLRMGRVGPDPWIQKHGAHNAGVAVGIEGNRRRAVA